MHEFRIHVETDSEGSSWWCEDGDGYIAVADTLPQLKSLIHEWAEFESIAEFALVMPDVQAEVAGF
ncbi:MAG: hypothetical protein OXI18_03830 [bacterium]|nr:hypothetical protein [bacterium]